MPESRLARARRSLPPGYVYRPPQVTSDPFIEPYSAKAVGQYVRDLGVQAQKLADHIDAEGVRRFYLVPSPQGDGHP